MLEARTEVGGPDHRVGRGSIRGARDAGQVIRSAEMDFEAGGAVSAIRSRARQLDSAKDDVKLLSARLLSVSAQLAEELMEKERKRLEIAGLKAELLDLKLRVEQTQAHLDGEVKAHLARRAAMNKDELLRVREELLKIAARETRR